MKQIIKLIGIVFLLLVTSIDTFAQVSATATATATIITPIGISKQDNMNFGNLAVSGTGGVVTLPPSSGTPIRTQVGGVTFPAIIGTVQAAYFTVTGTAGAVYAITLPTDNIIREPTATETMTVDQFTSNPAGTGLPSVTQSILDVNGTDHFWVGANVTVNANQLAGVYTSITPFTVTINYY